MKQLLRARPRHDAKERKRKDAGVYVRKVEHHRPRQKARAGAVRKDAGGARASEHGAVHFRAGNVDLRAQVWVTHRFLERGARVGLREVNLVASVRREHALAAQHRATEVPVRFGQILVASPSGSRHGCSGSGLGLGTEAAALRPEAAALTAATPRGASRRRLRAPRGPQRGPRRRARRPPAARRRRGCAART